MTLLVRSMCGVLAVWLCMSWSGCTPASQSQLEEEKEPHFLDGKSCVNSMDYKGAIEKFEEALETNPHSASAHFQLGWLYEEKEPDPAAAIYHYEQFLKLRPNYENAEVIRQHIINCKQDLAKTISPLPIAPGMQHQFEQLADENKRLRDELDQWKTYYTGRSPTSTNLPPGSMPHSDPTPPAPPVTNSIPSGPGTGIRSATPRTHTVLAGDSFYSIAKKYNVKVSALMVANPGVEPTRLKVGQTLNVPSP